eukprot:GHVT01025434.1.p1 GENE.GHVT01025434.1~~GHVT01025434.1.p1  ORF type:complete len:525 (+),score=17.00 GHVT01025434.1:411-1985(+)
MWRFVLIVAATLVSLPHKVLSTRWFSRGLPFQLQQDAEARIEMLPMEALSVTAHLNSFSNNTWPCVEKYFKQTLDHFNPLILNEYQSQTVWLQRYFHCMPNAPFQEPAPGTRPIKPIFVYIGGEGPLTAAAVGIGMVSEMAQNFGANLFGLEHRFYGKSHPRHNSTVSNLQWLTSNQALADLGKFIHTLREQQAQEQAVPPESIPVIVFGCSYPGALAAYARTKYPALILGAVASSCPVEARENFSEYDRAVKAALDSDCGHLIQQTTQIIERRLFSGNRTMVEETLAKFQCGDIPLHDDDDLISFLYVLADVVASAVQYNRPQKPMVDDMCRAFHDAVHGEDGLVPPSEKSTRLIDAYAKSMEMVSGFFGNTCSDWDMLHKTDTALGEADAVSQRLWLWQSCTEYGFWQTGYQQSVRSTKINLQWHMKLCDRLFPLESGSFTPMVATESNIWTGGKNIAHYGSATNIHFTNGGADPWASLSVTSVDAGVEAQGLSAYVIKVSDGVRNWHLSWTNVLSSCKSHS